MSHETKPGDTELNEDRLREKLARRSGNVLSEKTPVQVGFVIGLLLVFASVIWWASQVSSKLDMIISAQSAMKVTTDTLSTRVADMEAWRKLIDTVGSPQVQKIEAGISELKRVVDLHVATTAKTP